MTNHSKETLKRRFSVLLTAYALTSLVSLAANPPVAVHRPWSEDPYLQQATYAQARTEVGSMKATGVIGMSVTNAASGTVFKVEDLVVDIESGRVVALILSSPATGTNGVELRAVPSTTFYYRKATGELRLDTSAGMLRNAPHFTPDHWPDFSQGNQLDEVYRAYRVESLFSTNLTATANRTTLRARERDAQTKTPFNQGENKKDLAITAKIRRGIIAREHMSVAAKNVTIVTHQGQVTLRGSVTTAEEKRAVGEIAAGVAQLSNVSNQLEIQ